jgi:hypothetical protein
LLGRHHVFPYSWGAKNISQRPHIFASRKYLLYYFYTLQNGNISRFCLLVLTFEEEAMGSSQACCGCERADNENEAGISFHHTTHTLPAVALSLSLRRDSCFTSFFVYFFPAAHGILNSARFSTLSRIRKEMLPPRKLGVKVAIWKTSRIDDGISALHGLPFEAVYRCEM